MTSNLATNNLATSPGEVIVRYAKTGPILGIIGACILFAVAGFFLSITGGRPITDWPLSAYGFILVPGLAGLWIFTTRLVRLLDRSPKVAIRPDGLVLCQHNPQCVIPWERIVRARMSQTTENGLETYAHLTVVYLDAWGQGTEARSRVDRLTHTSDAILAAIKYRSNLKDV